MEKASGRNKKKSGSRFMGTTKQRKPLPLKKTSV
jgi:hypothetical protein